MVVMMMMVMMVMMVVIITILLLRRAAQEKPTSARYSGIRWPCPSRSPTLRLVSASCVLQVLDFEEHFFFVKYIHSFLLLCGLFLSPVKPKVDEDKAEDVDNDGDDGDDDAEVLEDEEDGKDAEVVEGEEV